MNDAASGGGDSAAAPYAAREPAGDGVLLTDKAGGGGVAASDTSGALSLLPMDRQVIATAEVTVRSDDPASAVDAIGIIATSVGGFVAGRDIVSNPDDESRARATLVLRVPTDKLDATLERVADEGQVVRVTSEEQDVTETVVDVDSRVDSARQSVERIRALLSQATTIGDVVRIESELARREADLESLLAQQRSLADQTAMATVTVTVLAPDAITTSDDDSSGFVSGLERGWDALVNLFVVALTVLGVLLPFLVVGAIVATPILVAWRRRHGGGRQELDTESAEPVASDNVVA